MDQYEFVVGDKVDEDLPVFRAIALYGCYFGKCECRAIPEVFLMLVIICRGEEDETQKVTYDWCLSDLEINTRSPAAVRSSLSGSSVQYS